MPPQPVAPAMPEVPAWDDGFAATTPVMSSPAPQPKPVTVLMTLTSGPMAGARFRGREGQEVFIGRDPSRCNLVLRGYNVVSGLHCRVEVTAAGMTVKDMGSSNGTWVDGVRLQPNVPVAVRDGSQIRLANQECVFTVKFE
jgi:pSer/pThr/pTyr-binding forkhead associated (FHA) protein